MKKLLKIGAIASALALTSYAAAADNYASASMNSPTSAMVQFHTYFAEQIKAATDGKINFEVFPGGSLLPADGLLSGLKAGVAQMADITANYYPSDLPLTFMFGDLSFIAQDQLALGLAYTETKLTHPKLLAETKKHDLIYAAGFVIGTYNFICRDNITSVDQLKGKRIRTATGAQVAIVSELGAVPVSVPASEIYTGMQRGSVDCTAGSPEFLTTFFKLTEVAKSVYLLNLGGNANDGYYFNKAFWSSLSQEERQKILDIMPSAVARMMQSLVATVDAAWDEARAAGVNLNEPEPEAVEKVQAFKEQFIGDLAKSTMEKRGVEDPSDLIQSFNETQQKWMKLLAEIDTKDEAQLTALIKREIYDKLDPATYGLD